MNEVPKGLPAVSSAPRGGQPADQDQQSTESEEMATDSVPDQSFRVSSRNGLPVVTAPAEIDFANAETLGEALASACAGHPTIIVDMSTNVICDSSCLGVLVKALKHAQAAGGELRLVLSPGHAPRVFKATGLDRFVRIFSSLAEATVSGE